MSSANLVSVIVVPEDLYDNTPPDSTLWETLRFTSENLTSTPTTQQSDEIRSDRMVADQFKVSVATGGGFNFEFSAGTFDTLLEGAMYDIWDGGTPDQLKISTIEHSYTIEKEFTDLEEDQYIVFHGMRVNTMDLGFTYGEAVAGSFGFAGASVEGPADSEVGAGSVFPATTTRVMNAVSDLSQLEIDGVVFDGCLRSVNIAINNNLRPAECIGSDTPKDQFAGTAEITGSIEAYLTGVTMDWYRENVLKQIEMSIKFTLSDGSATYEFNIPRAKITGDAPNAEGINTDVFITADYLALYDETADSSLVITRTPSGGVGPGSGAVPATGADAGAPGSFTPAGSVPPVDLAGMSGITANPATEWSMGQYVETQDNTKVYWDSSQWVEGEAPGFAATGADEGNPGTFTPAGANVPADFAALSGVTANPATAWSTGNHVVLGDASQAYWDSAAWQVGVAP